MQRSAGIGRDNLSNALVPNYIGFIGHDQDLEWGIEDYWEPVQLL